MLKRMATLTTPCKPLVASPIVSAQPGGGLCMSLELAWGRWRRAWLRRFRPGYVARMKQLRQGECPNCPHDIIDSRDLKFYRNVCGYWFRPEDDAFAWRGRLRLARYGLAELVIFSFVLLGATAAFAHVGFWHLPLFWVPAGITFALWLFIVSFFRDPERTPPADPAVLVSPADGTVTDIGEVAETDFPGGRAFRISIFLSVFNVHVNRVPRTARVTARHYYPGTFVDARALDCGIRNEQLWIDFEEPGGRRIRVKQIAGAIARRIVCWLRDGEEVRVGERFGMIKFGSRTDVLVPPDAVAEVLVTVGDTVQGAATGLLRLR